LDNEGRHRNKGVCADNEVFDGSFPSETFFISTARFEDMTQKNIDSIPKKSAAKKKTASPRKRATKSAAVQPESVEQKAYELWESRGRPMGSPEEDWFKAKEHLEIGERGNESLS
jgi:hypothetical protein